MAVMTTVYLARHGETVWHDGNRYAGSSDVALTEKGHEQGRALAEWAVAHGVTEVHSSPLRRAAETAGPAADALGVPLRVDERLREVHFGAGEGLTAAEMHARFPQALRAFRANPATSPLPEAESGSAALDRAWPALLQIGEGLEGRMPGRDDHAAAALVVMHSTLLRLVLCRVLGVPLDTYRTLFPEVINIAITAVRLPTADGGHAALLAYNSVIWSAEARVEPAR